MARIFSTAEVPFAHDPSRCCANVHNIMAVSPNLTTRTYYWDAYHKAVGVPMRDLFNEYIDLKNEAAVANGYQDAAEMITQPYASTNFIDDIDQMWQGLKPLYQEMHAYVRHKLHSQ